MGNRCSDKDTAKVVVVLQTKRELAGLTRFEDFLQIIRTFIG